MYELRQYQKDASRAAIRAFTSRYSVNGLLILPTGAGKSLIIADIAYKLDSPLLIFQPSKEILTQNFQKLQSYGYYDCSVFSASVGRKEISKVTFATIGSAFNKMEQFRHFKYIIIDECHDGVNPRGGQMEEFLHDVPGRQVIGLTATPYRLARAFDGGSELKFLTRTRPRIFSTVLYYCQVGELLAKGYLAKMEYFDVSNRISFDLRRVRLNSTGADYDDRSLRLEYERCNFATDLYNWTLRVMHPRDGSKRSGVLVFTKFVNEAVDLVGRLAMRGVSAAIVSGDTPKKQRDAILADFKKGLIQVVANAEVLTTGFDYPELDTIVLARPTRSLAKYYQMVGRAIRPHPSKKSAWVLDLCSNYKQFGAVSDLRVECPPGTQKWMITSRGRRLTNVSF